VKGETMFEAWQAYDAQVVPKEASPVQREECRRAFYAGAWAAYQLVLEAAGDGDDSCHEGEKQLAALGDEIVSIVKDLAL
jgi:hypothetical protein